MSVEQDGTGKAWEVALAICRGVGATKGGAIESSCREETLTDLFAEQAIWPTIIAVFRESYKQLKALGCSDEALCHEMWLSKEPAEVFEMMVCIVFDLIVGRSLMLMILFRRTRGSSRSLLAILLLGECRPSSSSDWPSNVIIQPIRAVKDEPRNRHELDEEALSTRRRRPHLERSIRGGIHQSRTRAGWHQRRIEEAVRRSGEVGAGGGGEEGEGKAGIR